ncbi:MAG: hypothetical protein JO057_09685 [Chloroflexi bacterium]|nr:hypothetical protein [Chloroflexota bacterium]
MLSAVVGFWVAVGVMLYATGTLSTALGVPALKVIVLATVGLPLVLFGIASGVGAVNRRVNARILDEVLRPAEGDAAVERVAGEEPPPSSFAVDLFGHGRRPSLPSSAAAHVEHAHAETAAIEAEFVRLLVRQGVLLLIGVMVGAGLALKLGNPLLPGQLGQLVLQLSVVLLIFVGPALTADRRNGQPPVRTFVVLHLEGLLVWMALFVGATSAYFTRAAANPWLLAVPPVWLVVVAGAYVAGWRSAGRGVLQRSTVMRPVRLVILWVFGSARHYASICDSVWPVWKFIGPGAALNGPGNPGRSPSLQERVALLRGGSTALVLETTEAVHARVADLRTAQPTTPTIWGRGQWNLSQLRCSDAVWQVTVDQLLTDADVVLMNLSGFGPHNAGCTWELGELIDRVPTRCFVLMVDGATDLDFLYAHLRERWAVMAADSPNRSQNTAPIQIYVSSREEALDERVAYQSKWVGSGSDARLEREATPALVAWRERDELARKSMGEDMLALLCTGAAAVTAQRGAPSDAATDAPTPKPIELPGSRSRSAPSVSPAMASQVASDAPRRSGTLVTSFSPSECQRLLQGQLAATSSTTPLDVSKPLAGEVTVAQFHIRRQPSHSPAPELVGQFASDGARTHLFVEIHDPQLPDGPRPGAVQLVRRARVIVWVLVVLACAAVIAWMALKGESSFGVSVLATALIGGLVAAKLIPGALGVALSFPIQWGWPPRLVDAQSPPTDPTESAWLWRFLCETLDAEFECDESSMVASP